MHFFSDVNGRFFTGNTAFGRYGSVLWSVVKTTKKPTRFSALEMLRKY